MAVVVKALMLLVIEINEEVERGAGVDIAQEEKTHGSITSKTKSKKTAKRKRNNFIQ